MRKKPDAMTLVGLAVLLIFAAGIFRNSTTRVAADAVPETPNPAAIAAAATEAAAAQAGLPETAPPAEDPAAADALARNTAVSVPYDTYFLTQGLHGESYGHLAIDIAAGNGSTIYSIINGTVTGTGYDQWNNTYIQIENDVYTVLYMHGVYGLAVGDAVTAGQVIGTESNIGYTLDSYGNVCGYTGRDCGYHTHLNVFDKRLGLNIDPLTLIPATYP
ncbi:MAG: M23 family metallopeptidase [Candidatus Promineofilum sp.]|nr:M23 family metallopeptidase [Promineifilum sp.]